MESIIYEKYHKQPKMQTKIISDDSFTYRNILCLLGENLTKNKFNILDVGSGVGTLDFYLAKKGYSVTGIDISKKAVSVARKNVELFDLKNIKFWVGNVNKFKFKSKFDLIIASEIIEHVEADQKLLKDLSRCLKPKGKIFLTTPLEKAPLHRLGLTKNFDKRVGHLRRYTLKKLDKLVKENNLKISEVYYKEGILRNMFFVFPIFDQVVRVANKFPTVSNFFTFLDDICLNLFGPSNIYLVIKKK